MSTKKKRPGPPDKEQTVTELHKAVQAFVAARGGDAWQIGPVRIETHKATSFHVVIECVGRAPTSAGDRHAAAG